MKPARSRDAGNTMLSKEFAGGILIMTGANSAVGLRSTPARYIFLDEVDAYPASADEEGDPVDARRGADADLLRTAQGVPGLDADDPRALSRIEREYEASDQRRYFVACPHCGTHQWLKFERLRWEKGKPRDGAPTHCEACDAPIAEHHKTAMLAGGEWRATATSADPGDDRLPPLGALLAGGLAELGADRPGLGGGAGLGRGDPKPSATPSLGETWVETGEAPDWRRLYDRRERWPAGTVPEGGLILTAGADVQKDRIEVDVWAWGRGLESWLVDHVVIDGGPEHARQPGTALAALLGRTWPHALRRRSCRSPGSRSTPATRRRRSMPGRGAQGFAQVAPVKGVEGFNRASPVSGPTYVDATDGGKRLRRGARLWTVAVSTFKAETYRFLRLERPTDEEIAGGARMPPGTIHLPDWVESEWLKQFVAEQLVTVKTKRGFARLEWQKLRERNEALDTRVYARAAAWIAGADRWSEERWADLEAQLGAGDDDDAEPPTAAGAVRPVRQVLRRRSLRSSYMG